MGLLWGHVCVVILGTIICACIGYVCGGYVSGTRVIYTYRVQGDYYIILSCIIIYNGVYVLCILAIGYYIIIIIHNAFIVFVLCVVVCGAGTICARSANVIKKRFL